MKPTRIKQAGAVTSVWYDNVQLGERLTFCLTADRHHDSPWCHRELEKAHLEDAKRRDALIIDAGDLFDAMQGRFDPRRSYEDLRPEYRVPNYYDAIVEDAAAFYKPYAQNMLLLGKGNHESGVLKHANLDLTSRLTYQLNQETSSEIVTGGYGGWIVFYMLYANGGARSCFRVRYFHGAGGEAPVTRGVIQTNRQAVYLPDADLVLNGHNHHEYTMSMKRERISNKGTMSTDLVYFVRTPGYKQQDTFELERGGVPKPHGCVWMELEARKPNGKFGVKCHLTSDIE